MDIIDPVQALAIWPRLDGSMIKKKRKKRYPSNLSEGAWRCLRPLLPLVSISVEKFPGMSAEKFPDER
jgi:hypothetical protein